MPKSDAYISFIIEKLKGGLVEWSKVNTVFCRKFPLSRKTFDKYWKIANEQHTAAQKIINDKKAKEYEQSQLKANKELILSRDKIVEMTANVVKLAYNKVIKEKGNDKQVYAFAAAVEKYNKLEGFDKPTKVANTDPEGKLIANIPFSISFNNVPTALIIEEDTGTKEK